MFRNYLTIAVRNLTRQLLYSSINIIGLAVGLACSLVIFLYVWNEWRHERHFENADRIYRVGVSFFNMGNFANGPELLADVMNEEFSTSIDGFTRFQKNSDEIIRAKNEEFRELVYYADSSFFKIFSYEFITGDRNTALSAPDNAVITASMAMKYFGTDKVLGEIIEAGKERKPYRITAVVEDDQFPSHLKSRIWLSLDLPKDKPYYWTSASVYNYLLVKPGVGEKQIEAILDKVIDKHVYPASMAQQQGTSLEQYKKDPNAVRFILQPLTDIYLHSKLSLEVSPGGNWMNVKVFGIVAIIILALAAVNFINLSTARASRRAREVGIRKTLGTTKLNLIGQFLLESIIVAVIAMMIALGLAELFGFLFFWITGQQLAIDLLSNWLSVVAALGFALLVGLAAGLYPALYMTRFEAAKVIKGTAALPSSSFLRSGLIVFQFAISVGLIVSTMIILRQMNYMSTRDLGFRQENVVTIDNLWKIMDHTVDLREYIRQQPGVKEASLHSGEPGSKAVLYFYTYQTTANPDPLTINTYFGDHSFLDVMGFRLIAGRNFNRDLASDSASIILNESAVKALGLAEPIGAQINGSYKVIGVVSDFHWESLRTEIAPLAIQHRGDRMSDLPYSQLAVKFDNSPIDLLKTVGARWKQLVPDEPFTYHYLDENFGALLDKEKVLARAIAFFAGLAIVISCLGLFGLSAYTTEARTKEIGIRKVMGASHASIMLLLNKQFTTLVAISVLIAIPIVAYISNVWLETFAYRASIPIWLYPCGALIGWTISCLTVLSHTLKATRNNPVETLKYE